MGKKEPEHSSFEIVVDTQTENGIVKVMVKTGVNTRQEAYKGLIQANQIEQLKYPRIRIVAFLSTDLADALSTIQSPEHAERTSSLNTRLTSLDTKALYTNFLDFRDSFRMLGEKNEDSVDFGSWHYLEYDEEKNITSISTSSFASRNHAEDHFLDLIEVILINNYTT